MRYGAWDTSTQFWGAYNEGYFIAHGRRSHRIVWRADNPEKSGESFDTMNWLLDQMNNKRPLSVAAVFASHKTWHSRRRALRRFVVALLEEYRR